MVVLEAMAAGVPVVASHVEGIPEAVRHRREGMLFEPGSVSQLAQALEDIVNGALDYPQMSAAAQQRQREHFSAESMAEQCARVYDAILQR
jgi:glycosyltransferase involved in cell wall biosynthesis